MNDSHVLYTTVLTGVAALGTVILISTKYRYARTAVVSFFVVPALWFGILFFLLGVGDGFFPAPAAYVIGVVQALTVFAYVRWSFKGPDRKTWRYAGASLIVPLLLSMLAYVFVNAANRSLCKHNVRTIQKIALSYANLHDLEVGAPLIEEELAEYFDLSAGWRNCPDGGTYTILEKIPASDQVYCKCNKKGHAVDL